MFGIPPDFLAMLSKMAVGVGIQYADQAEQPGVRLRADYKGQIRKKSNICFRTQEIITPLPGCHFKKFCAISF